MFTHYLVVNPHPAPDPDRLARILDETLDHVITLLQSQAVPCERLAAAGIPSLVALIAERQRRQTCQAVAS